MLLKRVYHIIIAWLKHLTIQHVTSLNKSFALFANYSDSMYFILSAKGKKITNVYLKCGAAQKQILSLWMDFNCISLGSLTFWIQFSVTILIIAILYSRFKKMYLWKKRTTNEKIKRNNANGKRHTNDNKYSNRKKLESIMPVSGNCVCGSQRISRNRASCMEKRGKFVDVCILWP